MPKSFHSPRYRAFAALLAETRKKSGMSQQQLADALGEYQSFVAKIEGGERRVDVLEFLDIAQILGSDPIKLLRAVRKVADH